MSYLDPTFFEEAADYLVTKGHTKGDYCNGDRRCVLGALIEVAGDRLGLSFEELWIRNEDYPTYQDVRFTPNPDAYEYMTPYADEVAKTVGEYSEWCLPDWNDTRSRRRDQVVRALRKTAERIRSEA